MDLQHQQLQQLTDWLDVTEARIKKMGSQPMGPDLEDVKHQVEEHKVKTNWSEPFCSTCQANTLFSCKMVTLIDLSSAHVTSCPVSRDT